MAGMEIEGDGPQQQQQSSSASSSLPSIVNNSLVIVIPGDDVTDRILGPLTSTSTTHTHNTTKQQQQRSLSSSKKPPKLGIGLRLVVVEDDYDDENSDSNNGNYDNVKILCTTAGRLLCQPRSNTWFIQQNIKRYRPMVEDRIIGIVEDRIGSDGHGGDMYRMNIGGPHPAMLSNLAFEGATKRNKPALKPGMLLYCRIDGGNSGGASTTTTTTAIDPTLSCMIGPHDQGLPRKDWMTDEGTYGPLKGGTVCKIPLGLARELLSPNNIVLQELARGGSSSKKNRNNKNIPYEICVGVNGYVWVHSTRPEHTIMIQNAILNSQVMTPPQVRSMVTSLVETVQRQIEEYDE